MDRFPKMLFCFPALVLASAVAEPLQDGVYGTRVVSSEDEHDAALAEGWHESPAEARQAHAAASLAPAPTPAPAPADENAPPTRAELEAKATELGIRFRSNTSDKALGDRIAAALEP